LNYDVVVVGSGGAGLAAAIQAHDEGARVVIIEKMPTRSTNSRSNTGLFLNLPPFSVSS
jgi:fumarate reductase flavoprotein subunit